VLDIGAYLGTFGLGIAQQKQLAFLCLVEANPSITPLLKANVRINCRAPHAIVSALVTGSAEALRVGYYIDDDNLGSASFAKGAQGKAVVKPTKLVTLSELREEHGPFDLIKLDVEGMELEILQSDAEFMSQRNCAFWLECNDNPQSLLLAEFLLSLGLRLYYFGFPSYNPDNYRQNSNPVFHYAYEAGILVCPKSTPSLDEELQQHRCILRPVADLNDLKRAMWHTPRWGMPDWDGVSAEELAALAGHVLTGDTFERYLTNGWRPGDLLTTRLDVAEKKIQAAEAVAGQKTNALQQMENDLRNAERLASEHLIETERERQGRYAALVDLEQSRARLNAAELELARVTDQMLGKVAQLGATREQAEEAWAAVAQWKARAREQEEEAWAVVAQWKARVEADTQLHEEKLRSLSLQLAQLEDKLSHALIERDAILNSTTWQMMTPMQATANRLGGRVVMRRIIRVLWWTVTFRLWSKLRERWARNRPDKIEFSPPASHQQRDSSMSDEQS
jgi:FkbM family methyltransferase